MEAPHSCLSTGEQSGGPGRCPAESHPRGQRSKSPSSKPHGTLQQPRPSRRPHPQRKRLRQQRLSVQPEALAEPRDGGSNAAAAPGFSPEGPPSSAGGPAQTTQEVSPKQKRERKPQRPGKYVCTYCSRACAKPSVLQKHIRSHTGERPYPCGPCGFSFKTKSNLYKHRKSHTHRVKAGLALGGGPRPPEEPATESEDESQQLSSALAHAEKQRTAALKTRETERSENWPGGQDDSYAVKKRLALRLSRGRQGPQEAPGQRSPALGSRGSTESGYFSRSESTEQAQDGPPNTSAKSYAEIILGKYGRAGHLQRTPRQQNQQAPGPEDEGGPFKSHKEQVIDHITKLISINEAVVDTSSIDRVKPRRFSLARKNSSDSLKSWALKGPLLQAPKADLGLKASGSITMGVPCGKFHPSCPNAEKPEQKTPSPLVRSRSMPCAQTSPEPPGCVSARIRSAQSFEERPPSERPASRRYGMLKRQPAVEIPLGAEPAREEPEGSRSSPPDCGGHQQEGRPRPYLCQACGRGCSDWEEFQRHRRNPCQPPRPRNQVVSSPGKASPSSRQSVRAGASALRKRRKEESFECDEPSSAGLFLGPGPGESHVAPGGPRRTPHTCSVIQHTSSFEKQEASGSESSPPQEEPQQESTTTATTTTPCRLARQNSVQVPEIFVTEDSGRSAGASTEAKQPEKAEEFQWPQRSPSLSQLPIEKLPPKKKRLRLAEVAQSSGESSFDSLSLPRSPSQDSGASLASSRSASFEEPSRADMEVAAPPSVRRSRAADMLTVPGVQQHREMRRSASEQAPHEPPPNAGLSESRSKSLDYSGVSPERSAVGWKERRKCLLIRHTAVRDPDEEEEEEEEEGLGQGTNPRSPDGTSPRPACGGQAESRSHWELGLQPVGGATLPPSQDSVDPVQEPGSHLRKGPPPPAAATQPPHASSGAARARYLPVSTGLKLEIPSPRHDCAEARVGDPGAPPSAPLITSSQEFLQPAASPAVAVRLQTDTLTLAGAIYTTLSQAAPRPPEKAGPVPSPDLQSSSGEQQRAPGKRVLSPSNSMEIHPEVQQQQKRVKEAEGEQGLAGLDKAPVEILSQQEQQESRARLAAVCAPAAGVAPSFPSLLPSTCNSWCYLNYTKPNPSALDKQRPSVYSSWSTAGYDPNPPGLSSKTALSLLSCKQRLSASIYTTSPMSASTTESVEQEDKEGPRREVYTSRSYSRDQDATTEGLGVVGEWSKQQVEEEEEEEEIQLSSGTRSHEEASHGGTPQVGAMVAQKCLSQPPRLEEAPPAGTDPGASDGPSEDGDVYAEHQNGAQASESSHAATQEAGPEPDRSASRPGGGVPPKSSASERRALFARRRLDAASSPCSPSPGVANAALQKPPTPPPSPSPGPLRPSSPPSSLCGDGAAAARPCADAVGPAHMGPQRWRGPDNLLRHLPLHSQQPGRAPSLLIPIGGIHMIQPRSLLPLYTLVSSPSVTPPGTSWRFSEAPKRRSPLQRRDSLRAAPPGSRAASPDHADSSPGE